MIELERAQREIFKAAQEFAKGEFDPDQALEGDKKQLFPEKIFKKAGELGFIGVHWPEEHEGGGLSLLEQVLVAEAWSAQDSSLGIALLSGVLAGECILAFGREEQKRDLLPALALGRKVLGFQPGQGMDLAVNLDDVHLRVQAGNDCWTLSGELPGVINGLLAQEVVLGFGPGQWSGQGDLVFFLLPLDQKGIQKMTAGPGLGWNLCPQAKVRLHGVQVTESELLGQEGISQDVFLDLRARQNILVAGLALGIAQGSYEQALNHAGLREQFGKKLIAFPLTRHKLARMIIHIEQARSLTYRAAQALDQSKVNSERLGRKIQWSRKKDLLAQAFMAKLSSARAAKDVADEAVQLLGGYGYMREYHVERFYRDAKVCELLFGSRSAQEDVIFQLAVAGK